MKIARKDIDALNASIVVTIEKADYEEKYLSELKKARAKVQMKGFRKGKTPLSTVKKFYGKGIMADAVNEVLQKSLNDYIVEEKLDVLGQPIPSESQQQIEFNQSELADLEFNFDLGLAPEFDVQGAGANDAVVKYDVSIPDDMVEDELNLVRKKLGKEVHPEKDIEEKDILTIHAKELDGKKLKEGGWDTGFTIMVDLIEDEKLMKQVLKLKKGDSFQFDVYKLEKNSNEQHVKKHLLNLDEGEEKEIGNMFEGTINDVQRIEMAELNQEFFDQYFGEGEISDADAARAKIKENIAKYFNDQAVNMSYRDLMDALLDKNAIDLPDVFLKRWLQTSNEEATPEVIENEYEGFAKNLRWNMIKGKLIAEHEVKVEADELKAAFKERLMGYFGGQAPPNFDIDPMIDQLMQDQKQVNQVYEELIATKLFEKLFTVVKHDEKKVSLDEFKALVKELNEKVG